jgi:glycosyltransferase involved in cell wall biosynthesis
MTSPLRVAVVARSVFPFHGYGGLERHVHDLVRHLERARVRVTLITRPRSSRQSPTAAPFGPAVQVVTVPYRTFPFAGRKGTTILDRSTAYPLFGERAGKLAWDLVRDGQIDIVHGLGASVLGYARRRKTGRAPLVMNPQGLEEFGATDPARARAKRVAYLPLRRAVIACANAADCVIATDRVLEPAVLKHLHVPERKVRIIPNAIDLEEIDRQTRHGDTRRVREAADIGEHDTVLLSVGRLEANKGFDVLLEAIGALQAHGGPLSGRWKWVLIGDGPRRRVLEQTVARMRLQNHVLMPGKLDDPDLHAWYGAATLFVHPTLYEGSSLVTLEAMSHRRAIVASNAGGLADKVRPGVNGWLVPPGQPSELAAAISGALARPEQLAVLGEASRAIVEREFAWPAVTESLLRLYAELLERGTGALRGQVP